MANLAGLSRDINAFWQQLHPDTPDAEGRMERFREFQVRPALWLHDYINTQASKQSSAG
jgi:hypothetical protein